MRVIALQGSPRPNGNTAALLETFLAPWRAQHTVTRFDVCSLSVFPCRSCYSCQAGKFCGHKDDMEIVATHLLRDDVIVVASPIYFYGVTAQLKAVIDRCQQFWVNRQPRHTARYGVLLLTAGAPDKGGKGVRITTEAMQIFFDCLGVPVKHVFAATNTDTYPVPTQSNLLSQVNEASALWSELAHRGTLQCKN